MIFSSKPFLRSSETEPEEGTSSTTTLPVVPILSTMYWALWVPMSTLSPATWYTPSTSITMSKFTTGMPASIRPLMGSSMPSHWGKATTAWTPQVFSSSIWLVISSALSLVSSLYSTVSESSLQRSSA